MPGILILFAILNVMEDFTEFMDSSLDFAIAFDHVLHKQLIFKLSHIGINGCI